MTEIAAPPGLCAYEGLTAHVRLTPFRRRFAYRLAQILIDVDHPRAAALDLKLFSVDRPNLFSFYTKDHGDRTGAPLRPWVENALRDVGVNLDGGAIRLLTFPRILNFVFNPISIFFGYGPDGTLRGVVYEVNNTFGEIHSYVASADACAPGKALHHVSPKRFHVSPFMDIVGDYHFKICPPTDKFYLLVENRIKGQSAHFASLIGKQVKLSDAFLLGVFFRLPLMTLKVVAGIHWEALWIWARGAGYRDKPAPPLDPRTIATSPPRPHLENQPGPRAVQKPPVLLEENVRG